MPNGQQGFVYKYAVVHQVGSHLFQLYVPKGDDTETYMEVWKDKKQVGGRVTMPNLKGADQKRLKEYRSVITAKYTEHAFLYPKNSEQKG